MDHKVVRFGIASGILFALLQLAVLIFLTANVLSSLPGPTAPAVERAAAFIEHAEPLRLGNYLMLLPVPFLLCFAAAAAEVLFRKISMGLGVPLLIVASAASMAMLWPIGGAISTIALLIAQNGGDAVVVSSLDAIAPYTLALSAVPRSTLIAGISAGMLGGRIGPAWIAQAGFGLALLSLAGTAVLADDRFFPVLALSTLLFLGWVIVVSASLLREVSVGSRADASNAVPRITAASDA